MQRSQLHALPWIALATTTTSLVGGLAGLLLAPTYRLAIFTYSIWGPPPTPDRTPLYVGTGLASGYLLGTLIASAPLLRRHAWPAELGRRLVSPSLNASDRWPVIALFACLASIGAALLVAFDDRLNQLTGPALLVPPRLAGWCSLVAGCLCMAAATRWLSKESRAGGALALVVLALPSGLLLALCLCFSSQAWALHRFEALTREAVLRHGAFLSPPCLGRQHQFRAEGQELISSAQGYAHALSPFAWSLTQPSDRLDFLRLEREWGPPCHLDHGSP